MGDDTAGASGTADSAIAVRPQPLGAFPLPAGFLLIPAGEDTEPARRALVRGKLPRPWPERLRGHELAMEGDTDGALAAFAGDDPVSRYNRFVIAPDGEDAASLAVLRKELGAELGALVDLVSFVLGRTDEPPAAGGTDREIAALVLSAQATHAVAAGDTAAALRALDQAVQIARGLAPALAGVLLSAAAGIRKDAEGPGPRVATDLDQALKLLDGTDLRTGRAEVHLALGQTLHELAAEQPGALVPAVKNYQCALQLVTSHEAPELWAASHANLAAAYLTMPMTEASDQLRTGVAVMSLRHALKVYTPEKHPQLWASTQLNLANALVYAPSTHQADNLVEAVELYEAVLDVRDRESDPLGRARVLANQGNALAHLAMFGPAREKLREARAIFEEFADDASARTVGELLDEVERHPAPAGTEG